MDAKISQAIRGRGYKISPEEIQPFLTGLGYRQLPERSTKDQFTVRQLQGGFHPESDFVYGLRLNGILRGDVVGKGDVWVKRAEATGYPTVGRNLEQGEPTHTDFPEDSTFGICFDDTVIDPRGNIQVVRTVFDYFRVTLDELRNARRADRPLRSRSLVGTTQGTFIEVAQQVGELLVGEDAVRYLLGEGQPQREPQKRESAAL